MAQTIEATAGCKATIFTMIFVGPYTNWKSICPIIFKVSHIFKPSLLINAYRNYIFVDVIRVTVKIWQEAKQTNMTCQCFDFALIERLPTVDGKHNIFVAQYLGGKTFFILMFLVSLLIAPSLVSCWLCSYLLLVIGLCCINFYRIFPKMYTGYGNYI